MKTIWKFPLSLRDQTTIDLPIDSKVLSVQFQNEQLCLWAIVDTDKVKEQRLFYVIGTGNPISVDLRYCRYLQTVQDGRFVWHIFESLKDSA